MVLEALQGHCIGPLCQEVLLCQIFNAVPTAVLFRASWQWRVVRKRHQNGVRLGMPDAHIFLEDC